MSVISINCNLYTLPLGKLCFLSPLSVRVNIVSVSTSHWLSWAQKTFTFRRKDIVVVNTYENIHFIIVYSN